MKSECLTYKSLRYQNIILFAAAAESYEALNKEFPCRPETERKENSRYCLSESCVGMATFDAMPAAVDICRA